MARKRVNWTSETGGTVEFLDGLLSGQKFNFHVWELSPGSDTLTLGIVKVDGRDMVLKTKIDELPEFCERYDAWVESINNRKSSCERCGTEVVPGAYHQTEWARLGGSKVKVTAYYCEHCAHLLHSIGAGEYSDMEARGSSTPSYEPVGKADY